MDKLMKKAVESELNALITNNLKARNAAAAGKIAKHIREGVKSIAKKFVKHLPKPVAAETKAKKPGSGKKAPVKAKKAVKTAKKEPVREESPGKK